METSVPPLQLAHLMLEGAVISLCAELIIKTLFFSSNQKSWLIRGLKITMAVAMIVKSSIFAALSSRSLMHHCLLSGRIADLLYHVSCLSAIYILLLRVKIVIPSYRQMLFNIIHALIMAARVVLIVFDVIYSYIWSDVTIGVCRYKDKHEISVTYTLFDTAVDFYVSIMITSILVTHIRRMYADQIGGNVNLYKSVVISNTIRTIILSIVNLICTVYYLIANDNPIMVFIVWPIGNMSLIVLVGYDSDITRSINHCKRLLPCTLTSDAIYTPKDEGQAELHHSNHTASSSNVINEPILATASFNDNDRSSFPLRRLSNMKNLDVYDDSEFAKAQGGSSDVTNSSSCTIINVDYCQQGN
ncbi:40S ribosomal protein [Mucor velutinosus]|uniref:40S ribosomal protein n=1 Tax=Mucor velutinosus TaxID=708070 RepID=A0AAN7I0H2_9FUNG|nr:40S ribosomal protein [Mucor velutinosus]